MHSTSKESNLVLINSLIHPWQKHVWSNLWAAFATKENNTHSPILLHGPPNIGKTSLAMAFAFSLLCENRLSNNRNCGKCSECLWLEKSIHPDLLIVSPEVLKNSKLSNTTSTNNEICLKQTHDLIDFINIAPQRGKYKVALLYPAEKLNIYAANALLKAIEEPPQKAVFILLSSCVSMVLPTIRSRSKIIRMPFESTFLKINLEKTQTLQSLAGGLIKGADIEPISLAEQLHKENLEKILFYIQCWLYDLLSLSLGQKIRYYESYNKQLNQISPSLTSANIIKVILRIQQKQRCYTLNQNINSKLTLEDSFILYNNMFTKNKAISDKDIPVA